VELDCEGVNLIELAQNTIQWQASVMNFWFPITTEQFAVGL